MKRLSAAKSEAQAAEAAAAGAKFADAALNARARTAIDGWRQARGAESRARAAANVRAINVIGSLVGLLLSIVALVHETGGTILVDMPQGFSAEFQKTLGSIFGLPIEAPIIKLSPSLMASALETP